MKKIIFLYTLISFCLLSYGRVDTKISGTVANAKNTTLKIVFSIVEFDKMTDTEVVSSNGKFDFKFNIKKTTKVGLRINDKYVVMPGVWDMLLEPGDDISMTIPEMKKAGYFGFGIANVEFTGRGSEKFNLLKFALSFYPKVEIPWSKQSITCQYEQADRVINAIDSAFKNYKGKLSDNAKDILKAQLYEGALDMLFISSLRNENDSLRYLFDKYILKKKRIDVFFKNDVIYYQGEKIVPNFVLLSEVNNPSYFGGESFRTENRIDMAKMELKYVKDIPVVRDFLLSIQFLANIERKHDDPSVKEFYKLYRTYADPDNPFYSKVESAYKYVEQNLISGTPFFRFSLPDPKGKIYQLSDFKGKVLVFDFWFNGCSGCKQMVPFMEELEKEYERKNVQFVSVNIDNRTLWLDGIGKYSSKNSLQLYTEDQKSNHPFIKYLNFSAYPRLIIVDKNGNMVGTPPDPRSDKEGFKKFVDKYL